MFRKIFGGEGKGSVPNLSSSVDEEVEITGEVVGKYGAYEKLKKMTTPILEGAVNKVEKIGFKYGDRIEIEREGKKQKGVLEFIVPENYESPLDPHVIYLSIKTDDGKGYADINLEDVISGQVKIKKIA